MQRSMAFVNQQGSIRENSMYRITFGQPLCLEQTITLSEQITSGEGPIECKDQLPFNDTMATLCQNVLLPNMSSRNFFEDDVEEMNEMSFDDRSTIVFLLRSSFSTDTSKVIVPVLQQLLGNALRVSNEEHLMKFPPSSVFILSLMTIQGQSMFKELASNKQPTKLYLLGAPPTSDAEGEAFFNNYPFICAMCNDPEELAIRLAVDMAMANRMSANRYARAKDKHCAMQKYDQCIELLNHLDDFAESKHREQTSIP